MVKQQHLPVIVTSGEPAGIGPDCIIALANQQPELSVVVIADYTLLEQRAQLLQLNVPLHRYHPGQAWPPAVPGLYIWHEPLAVPVQCGVLNHANVPYVLRCLELAVQGCQRHHYHGVVTGPVHKGLINEAGIPFSGHTEWIAQYLQALHPLMVLVAHSLRIALVTTHLPLAKVPAAITINRITESISVLAQGLSTRFAITNPHILVCGLNPHAGEGGYLGREEIEVITPALEQLRQQGYRLTGPVPADTAFLPQTLNTVDAVLAMYHDQGLPVIKSLAFDEAVNVTLGLPIIRTSVDHGTALSLAGTGCAQYTSLAAAIQLAQSLNNSEDFTHE